MYNLYGIVVYIYVLVYISNLYILYVYVYWKYM